MTIILIIVLIVTITMRRLDVCESRGTPRGWKRHPNECAKG